MGKKNSTLQHSWRIMGLVFSVIVLVALLLSPISGDKISAFGASKDTAASIKEL